MSSNINLNPSIQNTLHNVQKSQKKLDQSFEKLSSGKKINKPSDDVVGSFKAVNLETVSRGIEAVNQYTSYRTSELGITQGELGQNLENLQQARELSVRGADDSLSSSERDGLSIQLADLGVQGANVSTPTTSHDSIASLDSSINDVATRLSQIGSETNRLDSVETSNQSQEEQVEGARSKIEDADIAQVMSQQVQNQLSLGFSIQVLQKSQQAFSHQMLGVLSAGG